MHTVTVRHKITRHEYPWPATLAAADPDLEIVTAPPASATRKPRKRRTKTPRVSGVTATPAAENTEAEKEAAES